MSLQQEYMDFPQSDFVNIRSLPYMSLPLTIACIGPFCISSFKELMHVPVWFYLGPLLDWVSNCEFSLYCLNVFGSQYCEERERQEMETSLHRTRIIHSWAQCNNLNEWYEFINPGPGCSKVLLFLWLLIAMRRWRYNMPILISFSSPASNLQGALSCCMCRDYKMQVCSTSINNRLITKNELMIKLHILDIIYNICPK